MPASLDRFSPDAARAVFSRLFLSAKARHRALELLRAGIEAAHAQNAASWGVTLSPRSVALNVGSGSILRFEKSKFVFAGNKSSDETQGEITKGEITPENVAEFACAAANKFAAARINNPSWRGAHSPGVLELLREEGEEIPSPSYASKPRVKTSAPREFALRAVLDKLAQSANLQIPTDHLASFFTALQTKGFVLLSGRSGTGKTRLALAFAHALHAENETASIELDTNFAATGQITLPPSARVGEGAVNIICDGQAFRAKISGEVLTLRGAAKKCAREHLSGGRAFIESEWDENGPVLRLLPATSSSSSTEPHEARTLFVPVRPDWNDPKALLGYFNPLLSRYEWTPLLRFLLRAERAFSSGERAPFFVVLDEVNLARVEHYFADFLAVLEAGRDESGRAREPLRFEFDPRASGELPPRELRLPPNLVFVGTLNDDETTWPLSPKVRDRAWLLPSPRVNFSTYRPAKARANLLAGAELREFARRFSRDGRFVGFDKNLVAEELEREPKWRDLLHELNENLGAHGFGFRVFDEIVAFCALARENGAFESLDVAFDFAILAKIAARFDAGGFTSRAPLEILLQWAQKHNLAQTEREIRDKFAVDERG